MQGSGLCVRDWQRDSLLEPLPLHKRFTLELMSGDDWDEVPDLYALHTELLAKHGQASPDTPAPAPAPAPAS